MAKRSKRFESAKKAMQDAIEAQNMLAAQHGKVLSLAKQLEAQTAEAEKELKEAAKEEAAADPTFRSCDDELFSLTLTESREVNVALLQKQLSKAKFEKVAKTKVTVTLSDLESAVKLGVVSSEEIKGAIQSKGFAASFKVVS